MAEFNKQYTTFCQSTIVSLCRTIFE